MTAVAEKNPPPDPAVPTGTSVAKQGGAVLTLGALGVVYGDIGTSPLYAMKQIFSSEYGLVADVPSVYGMLSLVFWSITLVVSVKYVLLVLRADNDGEGGTMALISLLHRAGSRVRRAKWVLVALGVLGAALFFADAMITPAVSVLGAVEGLEIVAPGLQQFVVPISLVLLIALFVVQRFGTSLIGHAFGPVMIVWFVAIGLTGLVQVVAMPSILLALSPTYAVAFFAGNGLTGLLVLGAVVLVITGSEALYADLGHFGRRPVVRAWFVLVMPALMLNYLGQGALILGDPATVDNPFYRLVPAWGQIPMLVLATAATVIASQAVITGAYSVTRQAVQLGYLPYLTIRHTSEKEIGQIYVPVVNWLLFVAVLGLVVGFGSSTSLAAAYGLAVTGTLAITTVLFFVVARELWRVPLWLTVLGAGGFLVIELAFLAANLTKLAAGGWFTLVIGAVLFTVLMTWHLGRDIVTRNRTAEEGPLQEFVDALATCATPPERVPGTAVFLNASPHTTPLALRYNVAHNQVLHEHVVVLHVQTETVPHVAPDDRVEINDLHNPHDGISLVTARFGFQDRPDVPAALRSAHLHGLDVDPDRATYFLSRIVVTPTDAPGMRPWRKKLFRSMSRNAASPAAYFELPEEQVVFIGAGIDV